MSSEREQIQIRRWVAATPEFVFSAWTDPQQLLKWWGPKDVECVGAEIDLRVGGAYRIANRLPDQSVVWISGHYEAIERPSLLIYTWLVENSSPTTERVTVRFTSQEDGTNIDLLHERIPSTELRDLHSAGWIGCLSGLQNYCQQ